MHVTYVITIMLENSFNDLIYILTYVIINLRSLPEKERLAVEAKVPRLAKRSTCTLSTLISLNAELLAIG